MYQFYSVKLKSGQARCGKKSGRVRLQSPPAPKNSRAMSIINKIYRFLGAGRLFSEFSLFYSQVSSGGEFPEIFFTAARLP